VLRNLISNAIKHHDRGEGAIAVSAADLGEHYRITVADDGPGIDPAFHTRIFGMFQVLKPRDEVEGSGLGLAIIEKQLRTLGCEIGLESDPRLGRGTEFHFTWPKRWPYGMPSSAAA
jgi:signal transduction histidine kinase